MSPRTNVNVELTDVNVDPSRAGMWNLPCPQGGQGPTVIESPCVVGRCMGSLDPVSKVQKRSGPGRRPRPRCNGILGRHRDRKSQSGLDGERPALDRPGETTPEVPPPDVPPPPQAEKEHKRDVADHTTVTAGVYRAALVYRTLTVVIISFSI